MLLEQSITHQGYTLFQADPAKSASAAPLAEIADIGLTTAQLALASNYPETATAALGREDVDVSVMPSGKFQLIVLLLDGTVSIFTLIILIVTVIVFLIWQHRAYNNLPPLGAARPDFSSGCAIAVVRDITSRQEERRKRLMDASQQQLWSAGARPNFT
jgi:hypothetical protein